MPSATEKLAQRVATEADMPRLLELMRVALGEGKIPRTREFFDWKHRQNPFGASPIWVAEAAGELVGLRIFMPWSWSWGSGRSSSAVRAVDTATHPDFQGKGIFKRLTLALVEQVKRDGVELIFNTPNDKSRPGYLKMGWTNAGKASLWLRPAASSVALRRLLRLAGPAPLTPGDEGTPAESESLSQTLSAADQSGLLGHFLSSRQSPHYRTAKPLGYLRWRYLRCPAARYHAASPDPSTALAIYRVRERRGLRELSISELLFRPTLAGARAAASALALAWKDARADYALLAFERDPWHALAATTAGFLPAPQAGPIFTTRPLNPGPGAPDPYILASFRPSIGDLELF